MFVTWQLAFSPTNSDFPFSAPSRQAGSPSEGSSNAKLRSSYVRIWLLRSRGYLAGVDPHNKNLKGPSWQTGTCLPFQHCWWATKARFNCPEMKKKRTFSEAFQGYHSSAKRLRVPYRVEPPLSSSLFVFCWLFNLVLQRRMANGFMVSIASRTKG